MYIKVRNFSGTAKTDEIMITLSKTDYVCEIRKQIQNKWKYEPESQRLFYKGKQLLDEYQIFEYDIQLNDVIQLMVQAQPAELNEEEEGQAKPKNADSSTENETDDDNVANNEAKEKQLDESQLVEASSKYYRINDPVDIKDVQYGAWFEAKIISIKTQPIEGSSSEDSKMKFFVKLESELELDAFSVDYTDVRPRARYTFAFSELALGDKVMVNYNIEKPTERGYWYDMEITRISTRGAKTLTGTVYVGKDQVPLENCKIKFVSEVMRIQEPVIHEESSINNDQSIQLRKIQNYCDHCKDVASRRCKECGCHTCGGKNDPASILLCDECNSGYHIGCLEPPLTEIPDVSDWYCPSCKNDENEIVKMGDKLKFSRKKAKMVSAMKDTQGRDWGRGMACVGRTKECTIVPKNHYGPVPGVDIGTCWKFRLQVSEAGIHRPHVAGIHGRETDGAYSLVLSGGYEDDVDNGEEFYYTGSGGRDLSGNKRLAGQSCNQTLTRMNKALAMNCNAVFNATDGAEAEDWRSGKPVRVVRNYKLAKHSTYAPKDGNRYDGIYKVVKYHPERGQAGFIVWRYLLRRDDPNPAPWTKGGQELEMIYPPGYLEAQNNEPKHSEENDKKRALKEQNRKDNNKKQRLEAYKLNKVVNEFIKNDTKNGKLWQECSESLKLGKQSYLAKVQDVFMCICCQEVVAQPVTTECSHNICFDCLKRSFASEIYSCPHCRFDLGKDYVMQKNDDLSGALLSLLPGYESGR